MINIKSRLKVADDIYLKNRVVIPPMASQTATLNGDVTAATLTHYETLAKSGAGLVIVEYTYVDASGRSEPKQLGIDSRKKVKGLRELATLIKNSGSTAIIQLTHAGGKNQPSIPGARLLSPSGIQISTKNGLLDRPTIASLAQVDALITSFVQAAIIAIDSGFCGLEIHAAHGYALNQWLSPLTNHRTDHYGGTVAKRSRILLEIVTGIKNAVPRALISVRIPGSDHTPDGLTINDTQVIARKLEAAGAHIINVSSGMNGWMRPRNREGEGYLVEDAAHIQKAVILPVIGVGGIQSAAYINHALQTNKFALAAVGRAILSRWQWGSENGL